MAERRLADMDNSILCTSHFTTAPDSMLLSFKVIIIIIIVRVDSINSLGAGTARDSSASGLRYKVNVTHVVSVRRSGKTDTSSTQYRMMSRLALT